LLNGRIQSSLGATPPLSLFTTADAASAIGARTQDGHQRRAVRYAGLLIDAMQEELYRIDALSKLVGDFLVRESICYIPSPRALSRNSRRREPVDTAQERARALRHQADNVAAHRRCHRMRGRGRTPIVHVASRGGFRSRLRRGMTTRRRWLQWLPDSYAEHPTSRRANAARAGSLAGRVGVGTAN
jgi:hypothetical protein